MRNSIVGNKTAAKSKISLHFRNNKTLGSLFKFAFAFGILYFLFANSPATLTQAASKLFSYPVKVSAVIFVIWTTQFVVAFRYFLFLRAVAPSVRFIDVFLVTSIGQLLAQTFFGSLASDISRLPLMKVTPGLKLASLTGSMFIDRIISLYGLVVAAGFGLAIALHHSLIINNMAFQVLVLPIAILIVMGLLGLILLASMRLKPVVSFLRKILEPRITHEHALTFLFAIKYISQAPKLLAIGVLISFFLHLMPIVAFAYIMGDDWFSPFNSEQIIVALPLAVLANMLPITPAGLGVGEAAFEYIASSFISTSLGYGAILFLQYRVMSIIASLPGIISLIIFRGKPHVEEE